MDQELAAPDQNESAEAPKREIVEYLSPIWAERRRILLISLAVGIVTLAVNFLFLTHYYKSTALILPEADKSKRMNMSDLSDLASMAGVSAPGSVVSRLYPVILSSETVMRAVINKTYQTNRFDKPVSLLEVLDLDSQSPEVNMDKALREFKTLLTTTFDNKSGTVTVTLEMPEPQLAADVLNASIAELDRFMRDRRTNTASEQVKWIAVRIKEVEPELRAAEEQLKVFRERNRRVMDSPELLLQQERLARNVQLKSTIYIELTKQQEIAKIDEIKNVTIVNVLDEGRAPIKKERPKRATNAAIAFLLTLVALSAYYALRPIYGTRVEELIQKVKQGAVKGGA